MSKELQYAHRGITLFCCQKNHCRTTLSPESICKRYSSTASFANLILCRNFNPMVVKIHRCKTSASSREVADFFRKDRRPNAHQYNKDWEYSFSAGTEWSRKSWAWSDFSCRAFTWCLAFLILLWIPHLLLHCEGLFRCTTLSRWANSTAPLENVEWRDKHSCMHSLEAAAYLCWSKA